MHDLKTQHGANSAGESCPFSIWDVAGNLLAVVELKAGVPENGGFVARVADHFCNPHGEFAADNLLLLNTSTAGPEVRVIEPNGASALMCGNGLGCCAAHLMRSGDRSATASYTLTVRGPAEPSVHAVRIERSDPSLFHFSAAIGPIAPIPPFVLDPDIARASVNEFDPGGVIYVDAALLPSFPRGPTAFTYSGEPHLVVLQPRAATLETLLSLPPPPSTLLTTSSEAFPFGTNVMYCTMPHGKVCLYRAFERSGRETKSCSTGASAIFRVLTALEFWHRSTPLTLRSRGSCDGSGGRCVDHVATIESHQVVVSTTACLLKEGVLAGAGT